MEIKWKPGDLFVHQRKLYLLVDDRSTAAGEEVGLLCIRLDNEHLYIKNTYPSVASKLWQNNPSSMYIGNINKAFEQIGKAVYEDIEDFK